MFVIPLIFHPSLFPVRLLVLLLTRRRGHVLVSDDGTVCHLDFYGSTQFFQFNSHLRTISVHGGGVARNPLPVRCLHILAVLGLDVLAVLGLHIPAVLRCSRVRFGSALLACASPVV